MITARGKRRRNNDRFLNIFNNCLIWATFLLGRSLYREKNKIMDIIYAECSYCGAKRYSWNKDDAVSKLLQHRCTATLTDREILEILDKCINEM